MNTTVRRALWVVLVLLCLGLVFLAVRGVLAVGAVPISAAPTLGAAVTATERPDEFGVEQGALTTGAQHDLAHGRRTHRHRTNENDLPEFLLERLDPLRDRRRRDAQCRSRAVEGALVDAGDKGLEVVVTHAHGLTVDEVVLMYL